MRRWLGAVLAVAVACAGPAGRDVAGTASPLAPTATAQAPTGPPDTTAPTQRPGPVPEALDWSGPALDGDQVDGRALAGGDVALWFWAPW